MKHNYNRDFWNAYGKDNIIDTVRDYVGNNHKTKGIVELSKKDIDLLREKIKTLAEIKGNLLSVLAKFDPSLGAICGINYAIDQTQREIDDCVEKLEPPRKPLYVPPHKRNRGRNEIVPMKPAPYNYAPYAPDLFGDAIVKNKRQR